MSYITRLDAAFKQAPTLLITPCTKYVFFSDCHRGIGNDNDNFSKNKHSYFTALQYYYQKDFSYIEIGDGDELWENKNFDDIFKVHEDVFLLLSMFYESRRLYMLYGNHDMEKKENPPYYEGLIFRSVKPDIRLYVTHGHQADLLNSVFWKLSRFLVRYFWTPLEHFGIPDPTSPAKNNTKKERMERKLITYAKQSNILLLTGHTHRPMVDNNSIYFNSGSCVHPNCITCIELCGYQMTLVKWCNHTQREVLSSISLQNFSHLG